MTMPSLRALVLGAVLAATGAGTTTAAEISAKLNLWTPPKHQTVTHGAEPFMEAMEKESNGELTFKLFSSGALLGARASLQGLKDGVAEVVQITFPYFPSELPYQGLVADLAMIGSNPGAIGIGVSEFVMLHCPPCLEEFKRFNAVYTGTTSTSAYVILAKTPVRTVADLKGKKVRTPGALWDRFLNSVGATPVNLPANEMYEGISRGILDVALQPAGAMRSYGLADVAKGVTTLQLGTFRSFATFVANTRYWSKLSPEQRELFMRNAMKYSINTSLEYENVDAEVLEEGKKQGVEVIEPSQELLDAREAFLAHNREEVIAQAKSRLGIAEPEPLIEKLTESILRWEDKAAALDNDVEKLSQAAEEEILSKIDVTTYGL